MLIIILFGPPGAGKGLQAKKIVDKYGLHHLSTGELIRQEIASGSQLGNSMEEYISRGELAPDDLVINMVGDFLEHHKGIKGVIFDGFPRTLIQAEHFDKMLVEHGTEVTVVLALDVPEDIAIQRIAKRGKRDGRSDDMTEATIRNRLRIYREVTAPIALHYSRQEKFVLIKGVGSIDQIFEQISEEIDGHCATLGGC